MEAGGSASWPDKRDKKMISGSVWIRRGAAASQPELFEMTNEQYADIMNRSKFEIEDAKESLRQAEKASKHKPKKAASQVEDVEDDLAQFNLATYSDEDSCVEDQDILEAISAVDELALGGDDPYAKDTAAFEEPDEEDLDDLHIRPGDNLLAACRTEDDISYLEVYVYEEADDNLYVHHDIMLPAFPLCVEWIGAPLVSGQSSHGNFAAVGTLDPQIEIWNLDVLEIPFPSVILGSQDPTGRKKKTKKTSSSSKLSSMVNSEMHTEAVMSLSWNKLHSSLLLSGSADTTVKLWDLHQAKALRSYNHHSDKVQTLQWNTAEASVLASAGYDRKCLSFDCRTAESVLSWTIPADPECLRWNPHMPQCFAVSDEEGGVYYFDTRKGSDSAPIFTLAAHPKAVTSIDWNPALPDCLLTASADKTLKLWNTRNELTCVASREAGIGKIFTGSFCHDSPNLVGVAGSKGVLSVLNMLVDTTIVDGFRANLSAST